LPARPEKAGPVLGQEVSDISQRQPDQLGGRIVAWKVNVPITEG